RELCPTPRLHQSIRLSVAGFRVGGAGARWAPDPVVEAVRSLHGGTTCRFLLNGFESRSVAVARGISQGCPLAPMLFIIALNAFNKLTEACERVCGYADDTSLYVADCASAAAAMEQLAAFSDALGLLVNVNKSIAIPLDGADVQVPVSERRNTPICSSSAPGSDGPGHVAGVPALASGATCRYLGI
ncbi:hypothetical protein PybrP1_010049, partial [[Pythium] brassicae (nom. inval.)]